MFLTYRYRIKDATTGKHLDAHARAVNYVWNYCCEVQRHAQAWRKKWPTWIDLSNLTAGTSRDLHLHSGTINGICREFAKSRDAFGRCPRWRGRKSLGWVPMNSARPFRINGSTVTYLGRPYRLWLSRPIEGQIKVGSFSQDARGRWYFNVCCEVEGVFPTGTGAVGIDLGLKTLATLSNGSKIENPRHTARYAAQLATAQRAGNGRRAEAIHAKIQNARRHHLHEQSTALVKRYAKIVVGNVSTSGLAKTRMAKSIYDAGWSTFREMLRYKAIRHGVEYVEVSERLSTQACSDCGVIGGPKGIAGLGMRRWDCSSCGASHDRDTNAARNILRVGLECQPRVDEIAA